MIKSYHILCSPQASVSSRNPQIQQVVLEGTAGFSLINICYLMSFNSKNFGLIVLENQSFNGSMVNFSSTENSSDSEVDFSCAKKAFTASFS